MKIAIMQPYLFPYIGYWQLINVVDKFTILDDVNYINKGFINRNKIMIKKKPFQFTLELKGASQNKLIKDIQIGNNLERILKTIELNYVKAPYFQNIFPIIKNIFFQKEKNLSKFIGYSLKTMSNYFEMNTSFLYSSEIKKNDHLKGQDKIIDICEKLKAKEYVNLIGGIDLYEKKKFILKNIELKFLKTKIINYNYQEGCIFPNLSFIHVIMHNSRHEVIKLLKNYDLN